MRRSDPQRTSHVAVILKTLVDEPLGFRVIGQSDSILVEDKLPLLDGSLESNLDG